MVRVLRAGALVGSGFEADLVGALLGVDTLTVLELMQRAAEAGVPVDDRGEGRFHLPEPMLDALRASTLPSLMIAQHRRLAELLARPRPASLGGGRGETTVTSRSLPRSPPRRRRRADPSPSRRPASLAAPAASPGAASAAAREHGAKGGPEDAREV